MADDGGLGKRFGQGTAVRQQQRHLSGFSQHALLKLARGETVSGLMQFEMPGIFLLPYAMRFWERPPTRNVVILYSK